MRFKLKREEGRLARSRAAAGLVLLVLLAHGFVVSSTHFHRAAGARAQAAAETSLARGEDAPDAPLAGKHAQCALCRLQRNFVSDLGQMGDAEVARHCAPLSFDARLEPAADASRFPSHSGRAPPLA